MAAPDHPAVPAPSILTLDGISHLIHTLRERGYEVLGPAPRDGAIVFETVQSADDLPRGWTAEQEPGRYRLKRRQDDAVFGYAVGPQSLKRALHPPEIRVFAAERQDGGFRVLPTEDPVPRLAVLGVRPCDVAAIAKLDRVLLSDRFVDRYYEARRRKLFVAAVQCTEPAPTCFCSSLGSGPEARSGFDLGITELLDNGSHRFLVEARSEEGSAVLADVPREPACPADIEQARAAVREAAGKMTPVFDRARGREILYRSLEHPRWQETAAKCLNCGNCTMVCPTCFCVTIEDTSDVAGQTAERWRRWDSCFNLSFTYIHGGVVRESTRGRLRHRILHKLATWQDQFGEPGCTGCGRCTTWCPVGIDFIDEIAALESTANGHDLGSWFREKEV